MHQPPGANPEKAEFLEFLKPEGNSGESSGFSTVIPWLPPQSRLACVSYVRLLRLRCRDLPNLSPKDVRVISFPRSSGHDVPPPRSRCQHTHPDAPGVRGYALAPGQFVRCLTAKMPKLRTPNTRQLGSGTEMVVREELLEPP